MSKLKINENRRAKEEKKKEKAIVDFNKPGKLQDKIDVIAEYLGIKSADEEK